MRCINILADDDRGRVPGSDLQEKPVPEEEKSDVSQWGATAEPSLWSELAIVFNCLSGGKYCNGPVKKRCRAWGEHVQCFLLIAKDPDPTKPHTQPIDFLVRHLDVVDEKFGKLLQFQALVLTAISVGLGSLGPITKNSRRLGLLTCAW